jgi:hypothetical protein
MAVAVAKPVAPSDDKRWRIVPASGPGNRLLEHTLEDGVVRLVIRKR